MQVGTLVGIRVIFSPVLNTGNKICPRVSRHANNLTIGEIIQVVSQPFSMMQVMTYSEKQDIEGKKEL